MLALIAGRGGLPARISQEQATAPLVCVLRGFEPDGLKADITFRLEHLGTLLLDLKARGVTDVCLCGAIERPPVDPSAIDANTVPLLPVIMKALGAGDDGALRAVIAVFETQDFNVIAAQSLAPGIMVPEGVLSAATPNDQMVADVERGNAVLATLSPLDVGQGCVVGAGQVWAIETLGGTDHMLATLPEGARKAQAVLVKRPKQGQDLRVDMPTIGPRTIESVAQAGLSGVVVEAGKVILLEPEATVDAADAAEVVLWARRPE